MLNLICKFCLHIRFSFVKDIMPILNNLAQEQTEMRIKKRKKFDSYLELLSHQLAVANKEDVDYVSGTKKSRVESNNIYTLYAQNTFQS